MQMLIGITLLFVTVGAVMSCNRPSPDQFFQTTVLNTNILRDFGSEEFVRSIQQSTVEFDDIPASKNNGDEARKVVESKAAYIEQTIERIEGLTPPDEDAEVIKVKALELYRLVLPVYRNEYMSFAERCDNKDTDEDGMLKILIDIDEKYGAQFEEKHAEVYRLGRSYAEKHNLNVQFGN